MADRAAIQYAGLVSPVKQGRQLMENRDYDCSDEELFDSLMDGYEKSVEFYKKNVSIDMLNQKFERVNELRRVFSKVLEEHAADGGYAVLALAAAATQGLARNLLVSLGAEGSGAFVGHLANATVIPMVMAWQEQLERDRMDAAISEMENG